MPVAQITAVVEGEASAMFAFLTPVRKTLRSASARIAARIATGIADAARAALRPVVAVPRPARRGMLAVAAIGALVACEPIDTSLGRPGPSVDSGTPVPVALLLPRGSANASDEVLARSLENAARLAISDLQNVTIDLRVYNTAG